MCVCVYVTVSMEDEGITTISPSDALRVASAGGQVHRVRQLLANQTVSTRDHVSVSQIIQLTSLCCRTDPPTLSIYVSELSSH